MKLADCYRQLDLAPDASVEEVKRAHRDLTKVWHPDRFGHDAPLRKRAEEKLKVINEAYSKILESRGGGAHYAAGDEYGGMTRRVRSGGREMRFSDLRAVARFVERGGLNARAELFDPSADRWIPITAIPQLRVSLELARMRRNRGWAVTCAVLGVFILFRRPTPGGLLIALLLLGMALVLALRSRRHHRAGDGA